MIELLLEQSALKNFETKIYWILTVRIKDSRNLNVCRSDTDSTGIILIPIFNHNNQISCNFFNW